MAFDVNDLMGDLFPSGDVPPGGDDCLWINTHEFAKRTAGMSDNHIGRLLLEMIDLYRRGLMKNGPAVRVDPPEDEEAADGTHP